VAADLDAESQGRIKTGVYHAEINDKAKEELHDSWRSGKVKVMCATIGTFCCVGLSVARY
jgi:ATP-dependent DNA helicase Q1